MGRRETGALFLQITWAAPSTMADLRHSSGRGEIEHRNGKGSHDGHQDIVATGHDRLMRILLRAHPRFCSQLL